MGMDTMSRIISISVLFCPLLLSGCFHTTRPGTTTTVTFGGATYTCAGETGCCCNAPIQHNNPGAGNWPDCATDYECVAMQPGGVVHPDPGVGRVDVNLCRPRQASPAAVPQIAPTQPSYCRVDL